MTSNNETTDHDTENRKRLSRRSVLKTGGGLGAASVIPLSATSVTAQVEELTSPDSILNAGWQEIQIGNAKPAVMESTGSRKGAPYYHIEMAPGTHEHHPDIPDTPIWGYKGPNDDEGKYPGKTIEATQNQRLKVEFSNDPLPETHLLTDSVDTAVHGTKPEDYEDRYPDWVSQFEAFGGTFAFPEVRTVTHAHGVHVESASDGLPEQWQSPGGIEGPQFQKAVYDYPNRQSPATLWYHDHALGITRLNVYAGLAGFYLIRGRSDRRLGLPSGDQEILSLFRTACSTRTVDTNIRPSSRPSSPVTFRLSMARLGPHSWSNRDSTGLGSSTGRTDGSSISVWRTKTTARCRPSTRSEPTSASFKTSCRSDRDRIPPPCFSGRPNGRTSSSTSQSTPAIRSP